MVSRTYSSPVITAGDFWYIDPLGHYGGTKDYMKKYVPFNSLFVGNEDAATIEVYPNGSVDRKIVLAQGGTRTIINEPFDYLIVKNASGSSTTISTITIRISREEK